MKKRELTKEELDDAARLSAAWQAFKDKNKGATQDWLGREAGVGSQGAVWQYLNARIPLNLQAVIGFARALGVSEETISPEKAKFLTRNRINVMQDMGVAAAAAEAVQQRSIREFATADELPSGHFVWVPRIDLALSAGTGREIWHIEEKAPLPFLADYIKGLNIKPAHAVVVEVHGPSMERTLFDGDAVIVDTEDKAVRDERVYALCIDGEMMVKRLFKKPGGALLIVSDNKERFPPIDVPAEDARKIEVVGRVRYRSGSADF